MPAVAGHFNPWSQDIDRLRIDAKGNHDGRPGMAGDVIVLHGDEIRNIGPVLAGVGINLELRQDF